MEEQRERVWSTSFKREFLLATWEKGLLAIGVGLVLLLSGCLVQQTSERREFIREHSRQVVLHRQQLARDLAILYARVEALSRATAQASGSADHEQARSALEAANAAAVQVQTSALEAAYSVSDSTRAAADDAADFLIEKMEKEGAARQEDELPSPTLESGGGYSPHDHWDYSTYDYGFAGEVKSRTARAIELVRDEPMP